MVNEEKRVIPCTADNAAQVRAVVRHWPQLHSLVKSLQDAGHFPGLRSLQFTLTGNKEFVEQGLDSLLPENAVTGLKTAGEDA